MADLSEQAKTLLKWSNDDGSTMLEPGMVVAAGELISAGLATVFPGMDGELYIKPVEVDEASFNAATDAGWLPPSWPWPLADESDARD